MTIVSALVFDLDQTLFDRQRAFDHWTASLGLTQLDRWHLHQLDLNGYGERECFFEAVASVTGHRISQQAFVQQLSRFVCPDPSLVGILKRLQGAYELAILTNGGWLSQQTKVQSLGLHELFTSDRIFVSSQIGFAKPDPNAFHHVAESMGVVDQACCYFGDQMESDVLAARSAGWRAFHVRGPHDLQQRLMSLQEAAIC